MIPVTAKELRAEAKAWREIAANIARRGLVGHGLCHETYELPCEFAMCDRVAKHLGSGVVTLDFVDPVTSRFTATTERKDVRVLAALFLALECEDEARSLKQRTRRGE